VAPCDSAAGPAKPADETAGDTTAGHTASSSSSSSSGCSSVLQLQEVCYRGPSMVEVILADGDSGQEGCDETAAAVCAVLQAAGSIDRAGAGRQQQQQSQSTQQPRPSNGDCRANSRGGGMHPQEGASSTAAAAAAAAAVASDLQAVSLEANGAQHGDSASGGAMAGQWGDSSHGSVAAAAAAGQGVWVQLEAALQACLKPRTEA
jgi:hypothetical protein